MVGFEAFVVSVDLEAVDIEGEYEFESLMFEVWPKCSEAELDS